MPENLQLLKARIKTSKNITQIAKAMEMIAASKIKRAQMAVVKNKPYANRIMSQTHNILRNIDLEEFTDPYITGNNSGKKLLILISPDKGLCGSLVTNMLKKFLETDYKNSYILTIGKKLEKVAAKYNLELVAAFPMGSKFPSYSVIYPIIGIINDYYLKGKVSSVEILYPEFDSIFSQNTKIYQLLPLNIHLDEKETQKLSYKFEPDVQSILSSLLPYYVEIILYNSIIEAFTSEQAARMIAMQNAKNNALDIVDFLTLSYNKSRQEKITNELLDLSNGQAQLYI